MFTSLQNPLPLLGCALIALLFIPAGFAKVGGLLSIAAWGAGAWRMDAQFNPKGN